MKNVRLGIVGTNFVSDWMSESVSATDGIECTAVYSRTQERGETFASAHGIPNVFTDYESFLSSDIDAVYIASPNSVHFSQAEKAIAHGRHVLCEKPAVTDERGFVSLSEAAKKKGVVLLEAMRPAHDPAIMAVRTSLGRIGKIRRAVLEFCQYSSRYDRFKAGEIMNAFDPKLGNAAVMDIGVYAIETAVILFGEPESVRAKSVMLRNGMEGMGTAVFGYDGFHVEIVYSKIHDSVTPSCICGEDGAITIGKISTGEDVKIKLRGKEAEALCAKPDGNNMVYEVADFVAAINGTLDVSIYTEYTRKTLGIIDEIRRQSGIEFR